LESCRASKLAAYPQKEAPLIRLALKTADPARLASAGDQSAIARLFVDAFTGHPIARLPKPIQKNFVAAHIDEGLALVDTDPTTGRVRGFAIGGKRESLERARRTFIYRNAVSLAFHTVFQRERVLRLPKPGARAHASSPAASCELRYLAVEPSERGRGIGSALLRTLEQTILREQPYCVWVLGARALALQFYLRHGFRAEFEVDGHIRMVKT